MKLPFSDNEPIVFIPCEQRNHSCASTQTCVYIHNDCDGESFRNNTPLLWPQNIISSTSFI